MPSSAADSVTFDQSPGTAQVLVDGNRTAGALYFTGNTGNDFTIRTSNSNRTLSLSSIDKTGTSTLAIRDQTYALQLAVTGNIVVNGGKLALGGVNNIISNVTVGGTVQVNAGGPVLAVNGNVTHLGNLVVDGVAALVESATMRTTVVQASSLAGSGTVKGNDSGAGSGSSVTLRLDGASDTTFNGVLVNGLNSTLALEKTGLAIQTLGNSGNTFSGGITISGGSLSCTAVNAFGAAGSNISVTAGMLNVNGRLHSNSYNVTIGANGTVAGGGALPGTLTLGGAIDPGIDNCRKLTLGNVTISSGAIYYCDINDGRGAAGNTTGWDKLVATGPVVISATSSNPMVLALTSLSAAAPAHFNPQQDYVWPVLSAPSITCSAGTLDQVCVLDTTGFVFPTGTSATDRGTFRLIQETYPNSSGTGTFDAISIRYEPTRPPGAGLSASWGDHSLAGHDLTRNRQVALVWNQIAPNHAAPTSYQDYEWDYFDDELDAVALSQQPIVLQINAGPPAWVFTEVPRIGTSRGEPVPQYWNPAYLQYYQTMLGHVADKLASLDADKRALIVGIRLQNNALNTESTSWDQVQSDWGSSTELFTKVPVSGGVGIQSAWQVLDPSALVLGMDKQAWKSTTTLWHSASTPINKINPTADLASPNGQGVSYERAYVGAVIDTFYADFVTFFANRDLGGVPPYIRQVDLRKTISYADMDAFFATYPRLMAIDTGCTASVVFGNYVAQLRSELMRERCLLPTANDYRRGYWEDIAPTTSTVTNRAAVNGDIQAEFYWRMLGKLDAGAAYSSTFQPDVQRAIDHDHSAFRVGIDFFNKYAGYGHDAVADRAPGGWIAFLTTTAPTNPRPGVDPDIGVKTKLGSFIDCLPDYTDNNVALSPNNHYTDVSPGPIDTSKGTLPGDFTYRSSAYGLFARQLDASAHLGLSLNEKFRDALAAAGSYTVRIIWYKSSASDSINFRVRSSASGGLVAQTATATNDLDPNHPTSDPSLGWRETIYAGITALPFDGFIENDSLSGKAQFTVGNTGGTPALHLIEITKD